MGCAINRVTTDIKGPQEKGVYLRLVDLERDYTVLISEHVILNSADIVTEQDQERVRKKLLKTVEGSALISHPSCSCGYYNKVFHEGRTCPYCSTVAQYQSEMTSLESKYWVAAPDGIRALINPAVWMLLRDQFSRVWGKVDLLAWIIDPRYKSKQPDHRYLQKIRTLGIERGWNNFVDNFDNIMEKLITAFVAEEDDRTSLRLFLKENRQRIFTNYVPVPNSMCMILEQDGNHRKMLKSTQLMLQAINYILAAPRRPKDEEWIAPTKLDVKRYEQSVVRFTMKLYEFYDELIKEDLSKKEGLIRKDIMGHRCPQSARAVITIIKDPHELDEIHLPWTVGVTLYQAHIISKLINKFHYTPMMAMRRVSNHQRVYDMLIHHIINELIEESPDLGLPVLAIRYPTLYRGSIQFMRVTKVKTDPTDRTISVPALCLKAMNGDFDGDELTIIALTNKFIADQFRCLALTESMLSFNGPRKITKNMSLPDGVLQTFNTYLHVVH